MQPPFHAVSCPRLESFDSFLAALDETARPAWAELGARAAFDAAFARMTAAWSSCDLDALTAALARSVTKAGGAVTALERTHLEDLALATAAASGAPRAIEDVDAAVRSAGRAVARTMRLSDAEADEAAQIARVKLLVRTATVDAAITRYSGAGPLRAFVASVVGQEALRLVKKAGRERPEEDLSAIVLPQITSARIAGPFLDAFKRAFHDALATLDARERTVLRLTVVDGLTADEVGAGYQVHRVTVARWLRQIRERLLSATRARLAADLALSASGLDAMVETHLADVDVSLSRVLRETGDP